MRKAYILIASVVLGAAGLTAQDDLATFTKYMKAGAGANRATRAAITAKDTATASAKATEMATAFDSIAGFWKEKGKDDAVKFAETARDAAKEAAAATTPEAQMAAISKAGPTCGGCHAIYRDGDKFKM